MGLETSLITAMYIPTLMSLVGPVPSTLEADTEIMISPDLFANPEQGRFKPPNPRPMMQFPLEHEEGKILVVLQVILALE